MILAVDAAIRAEMGACMRTGAGDRPHDAVSELARLERPEEALAADQS